MEIFSICAGHESDCVGGVIAQAAPPLTISVSAKLSIVAQARRVICPPFHATV
jgi:hypothetical protein